VQLNLPNLPSQSSVSRKLLPFLPILSIVSGCGVGVNVTPISELTNTRENTEVILHGTAIDLVPFLDSGAYQLQDETGTVWVVSPTDLPTSGESLQITGILVDRSIPINGVDYGEIYIEEIDRKTTQQASPK